MRNLFFCFLLLPSIHAFEEFGQIKRGYRNKHFNISFCNIPSIHVCLMRCMEIIASCESIDFSGSLRLCRIVDRIVPLVKDDHYMNLRKVRVNGGFTEWSTWSQCTKTCGGGTQFRNRTCTNPEPSNSGEDCKGNSSEVKNCNVQPCHVTCTFVVGFGIDANNNRGNDIRVGQVDSSAECIAICLLKRIYHPTINDVAIAVSSKICYCEKNMTTRHKDSNFESCIFGQ